MEKFESPKKIECEFCPHCKKVISEKSTTYDIPVELLAIIKQMEINIKDLHR